MITQATDNGTEQPLPQSPTPTHFALPAALFEKLTTYISHRPWIEVHEIIGEISKETLGVNLPKHPARKED